MKERIRSGDLPLFATVLFGIDLSPGYLRVVRLGTDGVSREHRTAPRVAFWGCSHKWTDPEF